MPASEHTKNTGSVPKHGKKHKEPKSGITSPQRENERRGRAMRPPNGKIVGY